MKKWLLAIVIIVSLFIVCIFLFIPSTIVISASETETATRSGSFRMLADEAHWKNWWNYDSTNTSALKTNTFTTPKKFSYQLVKAGDNSVLIKVRHKDEIFDTNLGLLQFHIDSIGMLWQTDLKTSSNPFKRLQDYFTAVALKDDMKNVLQHYKGFIQKKENIYGYNIQQTGVKDSLVITTAKTFATQPTTVDVYKLIDVLKNYAVANNCKQVDAPMLNISKEDTLFRLMVGLPVNKFIPAVAPVSFTKMANGYFMRAEVKGGLYTVDNALQEMKNYFEDYDRTSMAITFQYLVTDRTKVADTSQWITEIYAPVL